MSKREKDEAREERISMEIIVDAYNSEEVALGWYYYLDDAISYASGAIQARCIRERAVSPLQVGDDVEILRMAPEDECECDMFVMIRWGRAGGKPELGVPLAQLEVTQGSEDVRQVVEDWHYWVDRGYQF